MQELELNNKISISISCSLGNNIIVVAVTMVVVKVGSTTMQPQKQY